MMAPSPPGAVRSGRSTQEPFPGADRPTQDDPRGGRHRDKPIAPEQHSEISKLEKHVGIDGRVGEFLLGGEWRGRDQDMI